MDNSFIPYDIKIEYNLPTVREKDAIYTYHFYRLLQRAETIHLLYNTAVDVLKGSEVSRYIYQLSYLTHEAHTLNETQPISPTKFEQLQERRIVKTEALQQRIATWLGKEISASALIDYLQDPYGFYQKRIIRVEAPEDKQEHMAFNVVGNIVHHSLEELYQPFLGACLEIEQLEALKPQIDSVAKKYAQKDAEEASMESGKNMIIFEVIKTMIRKAIDIDIQLIKRGKTIKLIALEHPIKMPLVVDDSLTINLSGYIDRVDEVDGALTNGGL